MRFTESYQQRFGGIMRLYGTAATDKLLSSHILIIGIGGVGSWVAEALVRSGLGKLTLMDMDDICISNTNRQVHTLKQSIGHSKTSEMKQRLLAINPEAVVDTIDDFIDKTNAANYINAGFSVVVDAIDNAIDKTEVIAFCKRQKISIITIGSSGGKKDPSQIIYGDLKTTTGDPLFAKIRNNLRRYHGFSRDTQKSFGIEAIYSTEAMTYPDGSGETCQTKATIGSGEKLDCASGYGAATMVTAGFGLVAASRVVDKIIK
ncbi:MAG: tRNA cyclic N6-threonylcarbamoyladenosine(37) synthase TcdA [Pseudomonadota bacterium]